MAAAAYARAPRRYSILGSAMSKGALGGLLGGGGGGRGGGAGMLGVLAPALMGMLAGGRPHKLMSGFSSAGLDDKAKSCVSSGDNQPLTAR